MTCFSQWMIANMMQAEAQSVLAWLGLGHVLTSPRRKIINTWSRAAQTNLQHKTKLPQLTCNLRMKKNATAYECLRFLCLSYSSIVAIAKRE